MKLFLLSYMILALLVSSVAQAQSDIPGVRIFTCNTTWENPSEWDSTVVISADDLSQPEIWYVTLFRGGEWVDSAQITLTTDFYSRHFQGPNLHLRVDFLSNS